MSIPNLTKKEIIDELLKKQLKSVPVNKLSYDDIQRLGKYIKSTIFDENKCSLWCGYIANSDNENKGIYINFYYKGKKIALHRILYVNYVGPLTDTEYLKFSCENKGKCCNIKHIQKFKYIVKKNKTIGTTKSTTEGIGEDQNKDIKKKNSKSFVITFD